jgi:hypothetical protein
MSGSLGKYNVKNNRRLARQLPASICGRSAVIVDLRDPAFFIGMHGNRTLRWLTAVKAIERADRDAHLVDPATQILEAALRSEGLLDLSSPDIVSRDACPT